jgi:signal transduction histidine kinase
MPENAAEIVFTAGARLDEKVAGHGLGLAIVHDIATLYGGHITIGKADIGGAHVALTLPVVKSQP